MNGLKITLIGGPTALIEILTDPTFDEPGEWARPTELSAALLI